MRLLIPAAILTLLTLAGSVVPVRAQSLAEVAKTQRAVIDRNRQRALGELDRLKKAIDGGKKAIAALEEEARRSSVPAGWLR